MRGTKKRPKAPEAPWSADRRVSRDGVSKAREVQFLGKESRHQETLALTATCCQGMETMTSCQGLMECCPQLGCCAGEGVGGMLLGSSMGEHQKVRA